MTCYVDTIPDSFLSRHEKLSAIRYERQRHRVGASHPHTSNIVSEWLAERVGWTKPNTHFWSVFIVISIFTSVTVRFSPRSFSFTSASVRALSGMSFRASLERFHSRVRQLCKFIRTKESFSVGLEHQHDRRFMFLEKQYGRLNVMCKRSTVWK